MKSYHVIVLGLVIVFGALLLFLSFKDSETLNADTSPNKNAEFGDATADSIEDSINHISGETKWTTPTLEGVPEKPLP